MNEAATDRERATALTPEEDSLGDPEEAEEEVDDFLPADLWF